MTELILTLIPLGLFVALSPIPIIAAIVLLGTRRPILNGLAFACGWAAVILTIGVIGLATLSGEDFSGHSGAHTGVAALELAVGVALLLWAARKSRTSAPTPVDQPKSRWLTRVESLEPPSALLAGAAFFIVNIGDVMIALVATADILKAEVSTAENIAALAVFTAVATASILAPVVMYVVRPAPSAVLLESCKAWLSVPRNTLIAVLVLIAVLLIINGLRGLLG